ncbi:hypothetical protein FB451DRAFT_1248785 [Mycena latifolia]|nr:hypothetical protein FB451DRAFT_1248785 [Mycena latifolia]
MPRLSSRQARTQKVLQAYLRHRSTRIKRQIRQKNRTKRALRRAGYTGTEQQLASVPPQLSHWLDLALDSDSESLSSSADSDLGDSDTSSSTSAWSDLLGSDMRESSESSEDSESEFTSDSDSGDADDEMPELHPLGYPDSDDEEEDDSDSGSGDTTSSATSDSEQYGHLWDNMALDIDSLDGDFDMPRSSNRLRWVRHTLEDMHAQRYEMPRNTFPRGPTFMRHVLTDVKDTRADLFREDLRVTPHTFDQLVNKIATDPVFTNESRNGQMPVEDQLAITLFRFGHSGNAAGLQKVANWAGVGKGTVTACCIAG